MRVVVYGAGAIGGGLAGRLAATGTEVVAIARGAMLEAVTRSGAITVITHAGTEAVPLACVGGPGQIGWRPDDIVVLTMKSQDTGAALADLRRAGVDRQPIVCAQNGVDNERMALRLFPTVHGALLMFPALYTVPGEVVLPGRPRLGLFDIGPAGQADLRALEPLATAMDAAGFRCTLRADAMAGKYGKLLMNLNNMVTAALGVTDVSRRWTAAVTAEGEAVLRAAGIRWYDVGAENPRRDEMKYVPIPGVDWVGSSSTQSLARGAGSIETDWLNGEIVMLGRMHGVPTPVNAAFQRIGWRMLDDRIPPGTFPPHEVERMVAAGGA